MGFALDVRTDGCSLKVNLLKPAKRERGGEGEARRESEGEEMGELVEAA